LSTGSLAAETAGTVRGSIGQTGPTAGPLVPGAVDDGAALVVICGGVAGEVPVGVGEAVGEPAVGEARGGVPPLLHAAVASNATARTAKASGRREEGIVCTPDKHAVHDEAGIARLLT
jgi:hypothetical protein